MITAIGMPILILSGTIGNILSLYIMRRGPLKNASTCFYMSVLAVIDSGKQFLFHYRYISLQNTLDKNLGYSNVFVSIYQLLTRQFSPFRKSLLCLVLYTY